MLSDILIRLRALIRRNAVESELDEEIRFHFDQQVEKFVRSGLPPEEARRQACLIFGGAEQIKQGCRDARGVRFIEALARDLRFGVRMLRKAPGFTAVAVLTLALGIGATATIFAAAYDFLLRPLPFSHSDRLVMVKRYDPRLLQSGWTDPPSFKYWREKNHVFEDLGAWAEITSYYNLTGAEGPERVSAKQVSSTFFQLLGVQPILGRTFSSAQDQPGGSHVAVISHSLWESRYGGSPGVVGKTIILNGESYTVIGVLPAGFRFSTTAEDVWTPLGELLNGGPYGHFLNVIGWLKPGVTLAQAQADMDAITAPWARQFPDSWNADQKVAVESLRDRYARQLRPALLALLVAAGLVLLIACANLAHLLLARAASRQKEIALRRALGASRGRIIGQMLLESALLAFLGGLGGLLIAFVGLRALYAVLPAGWQPITRGGIDAPVLAFTLAIMLLTVFVIGIAPAWSATGYDLIECLKECRRSSLANMSKRSFRGALIAGEIALAVMLLTGAALVLESFVRLSAVNLGFDSDSVLTVNLARNNWAGTDAFYNDVLERIAALPRVQAVGAINIRPLSGADWGQDIIIEGRPPRPSGDLIWASHRQVSPGYFRAMRIPLIDGRSFAPADENKDVAVISETMARRYWPGENPVGKRFGVNCARAKCRWNSIIGVVGDVKELGVTSEPVVAMYFLETTRGMTLVVRAAQAPTNLIANVRDCIHSVDPAQPIGDVRTMDGIVSESIAPQRLTMLIAGLFAALALLLAMVGLYGVIAYSVAQRNREFGVRMALGAAKSDILHMVVAQGFRLALAGMIVGMAGALALTRALASLLFGVKPADPLTFGAVALLLVGVALLACYIPARRASKIDPMVALRYE
jgi:putative ABC transport system permease protein